MTPSEEMAVAAELRQIREAIGQLTAALTRYITATRGEQPPASVVELPQRRPGNGEDK